MNKRLYLPAWLLAVAIFAQVLMALLNAKLIWDQKKQPKAWSLDSTTYYKYLEGQGRLNLNLYQNQQAHAARLQKLDKTRTNRHRHIDTLSGDALQREIDQQYNGRQSPKTGASNNPPDGNGRTSGAERPGRSDHAVRRGSLSRYVIDSATAGNFDLESIGARTEPTPAAGHRSEPKRAEPGRAVPEEVARSSLGKLAHSGRGRDLRSAEVQTHLRYWQLVRAQGFTYPDVAWAISAVETGYWYRPSVGHNIFGMKKNARHLYTSIRAGGYCRYASEERSLADYAGYERAAIKKYELRNRRAYLAHIYQRYCRNPAYPDRMALAFSRLKYLKSLA